MPLPGVRNSLSGAIVEANPMARTLAELPAGSRITDYISPATSSVLPSRLRVSPSRHTEARCGLRLCTPQARVDLEPRAQKSRPGVRLRTRRSPCHFRTGSRAYRRAATGGAALPFGAGGCGCSATRSGLISPSCLRNSVSTAVSDILIVLEELAGVFASLADALALIAEPGAALLDDVVAPRRDRAGRLPSRCLRRK